MNTYEIGGLDTGLTLPELFETDYDKFMADSWDEKQPMSKEHVREQEVARAMARTGITCPKEYAYYSTI